MRGAFPPTPSFVSSARRAAQGCEPRGGRLGRDSGTKPARSRSAAGRASRDGSAGRLRPVSHLAAQLPPPPDPARKRQRPPGRGCARTPGPQEAPPERGAASLPAPGPRPAQQAEQGTPGEGLSSQSRLGGSCAPLPATRDSSSARVSVPRGRL